MAITVTSVRGIKSGNGVASGNVHSVGIDLKALKAKKDAMEREITELEAKEDRDETPVDTKVPEKVDGEADIASAIADATSGEDLLDISDDGVSEKSDARKELEKLADSLGVEYTADMSDRALKGQCTKATSKGVAKD